MRFLKLGESLYITPELNSAVSEMNCRRCRTIRLVPPDFDWYNPDVYDMAEAVSVLSQVNFAIRLLHSAILLHTNRIFCRILEV